ncbi:MAG: GAF domain-containing protein, partial [Burkholderiales bacterium]|nr:GAF domain-containing protein [Burkholderiales bacterium]
MKPSQPLDPSLIRRAHDQFLSSGNAPRGLVPDYIQNSWARSHGAGVDADQVREIGRLSPTALREAEDRLHNLVEEASPVMDRLHREISGTGSVVLLCGPDGLILRSVGDPEFLQRADRVALAPGVCWGEQEKGTNAIGTAIVEQKPVIVFAAQHYVQTHHFLTCSAAPILDPLGRVTGVLDITGDYRSHQTHTMALVKMSAQIVERQLFRRHFRDQVVLRFHPQLPYLGSIYDAQVAFSEDGRQLSANGAARELLAPLAALGCDFDTLFGLQLTEALPTMRNGDSGMGEFVLPDGTRVF